MCAGLNCIKKEQCYRHTARPDMVQSYFTESPFTIIDDHFECEYFWDINKKTIVRKGTMKKNVKQK